MNFVVGLVVLVAFGILIYSINFLKNTKPGEKTHRYHVLFAKVSTLQVGDPVKLNGVTMGRVKVIELYQNRVKVSFDLKQSFINQEHQEVPIQIPVNSDIRVQNIGLMGERQIEIHLGDASQFHAPGSVIQNGTFDAGIAEAMGVAGQVFEEAEDLVGTMRNLVDSTVGDSEFVTTFQQVYRNTRVLSDKVMGMVDTIKPKVVASSHLLHLTAKNVHQLVETQKEPLEKMIGSGQIIASRLEKLTADADTISGEMKSLIADMKSNKGTVGALLYDSAFYQDLQSTVNNTDSLVQLIRKQGLDVNVDLF